MKIARTSKYTWLFWGTLLVLAGLYSSVPTRMDAQQCLNQSQGYNTVYASCSGSLQGSFALIDAVPYATDSRCTNSTCDICQAIQWIFADHNSINANGIVVDARGITSPSTLACTHGVNPWTTNTYFSFSNVVLLPSGTITIDSTWALPSRTQLIGQGPNLTTIQTCTTSNICQKSFTGTDIVDMGTSGNSGICFNPINSNTDCPAVGIEHLRIDGSNNQVNGIVNCCSQELSFVNDVALTNIASGKTGLTLTHNNATNYNADNSGPYSNIFFSGAGKCISVTATTNTRGFHGLTCISTGTSGPLISIDGTNNSIRDVYLQGGSTQQDGIALGFVGSAQGNMLTNIVGNQLANVIHISNQSTTSAACPNYDVCDVTILGVTKSGGTSAAIRDDLPGGPTITDTNVGMYVVGEPIQGNGATIGYSRFTTSVTSSAHPVSWLVGTNSPMGTCPTGSLLSCTNSSNCTKTLWGCAGGGWTGIK
jgi:hypothetical protein